MGCHRKEVEQHSVKILAVSYAYAPNIGGVETMTRVLADEWLRMGHEVQVVTHVEGDSRGQPCPVFRRPNARILKELHEWSEIVWHNNVSLTYAFPALRNRRRKPWFVSHGVVLDRETALPMRLAKAIVFRVARNIAVTRYVQQTLGAESVVIPNPYDHRRFNSIGKSVRNGDAVFLGRLVSDKGADVAIQACHHALEAGVPFSLTLIGKGPEEGRLGDMVAQLGLRQWVRFAGALTGEHLVLELNRHRVMLVPSRWHEPFGIVALEGAACGLVVVAATHGGLPEAVGPCGPCVDIRDVAAWSKTTQYLLGSEEARKPYLEAAPAHVQRHNAELIATEYLELFRASVARSPR